MAYQIRGNHKCRNMVANSVPADPPTTADGTNRSKFIFVDHGHVAYQIYGNHECSNIVANILQADPDETTTLGDGMISSKFNVLEHGYIA